MQRRTFLMLGGAAVPTWIAAAYGLSGPRVRLDEDGRWHLAGGRAGPVRQAWKQAAATGRPVLVLLVPRDEAARPERGHVWGETLQHGGPALLADLALCELVCATGAELAAALPEFPGLPTPEQREPVALLLETDRPQALRVDVELASIAFDWSRPPAEAEPEYERAVRERVARLAAALREAIAPDLETIGRRARQAASALGVTVASLTPPAELDEAYRERVAAAPAIARVLAEQMDREDVLALLAGLAGERWVRGAPRGTGWANDTGCGVEREDSDERSMVACGMACVPDVSRRFLAFYTE